MEVAREVATRTLTDEVTHRERSLQIVQMALVQLARAIADGEIKMTLGEVVGQFEKKAAGEGDMEDTLRTISEMVHYPQSVVNKGDGSMTTIVGMVCKDGLVIASDSKATRGPSVREEYLKIWNLKVTEKLPALITGAGRGAYIDKYRQLLEATCRARAEGKPIKNSDDLVKLAEHSMQALSREYGTERLARLGFQSADEHQGGFLAQMLFPDLVAVIGIYDGVGRLFSVSAEGVAEEQQGFGSEGSGGPYANYLLSRGYHTDITVAEAEICAIHIVEQVKHADPHSGGPTRLASITKPGIVKHWSRDAVQVATTQLEAAERKHSNQWCVLFKSVARKAKKT